METARIDQTQRPVLTALGAAHAREVHAPDFLDGNGFDSPNLKQTLRDGVGEPVQRSAMVVPNVKVCSPLQRFAYRVE
jgi:hypothetical protein